MKTFKAEFDGEGCVERASAEHHYTHAWLVVCEAGGELTRRYGLAISRRHAERSIDDHRRLCRRPFSRVRVVRAQISEAVCDSTPRQACSSRAYAGA